MAKKPAQAISKKLLTILLLAGMAAAVIGMQAFKALQAKAIDPVAARAIGSSTAPVQIIEFIDMQCPACAYGSKMIKGYVDKYPDKVRLQLRYFPLKSHAHAMTSALYSECAGRQGKFWEFHERLMASQSQWSALINPSGIFDGMARETGIDMQKLNACLASEDAAKAVENDKLTGQTLGVQSTPTYFINSKMVVGTKSLTEELNTLFPQGE